MACGEWSRRVDKDHHEGYLQLVIGILVIPGLFANEFAGDPGYRYLRGSASRPSMALAVTVAGLARKMRASREPMRPW